VPIAGLILIASLILAWGLNWPAAKLVLTAIPPLLHRAIILPLGGAGLLAIARLTGHSLKINGADASSFLLVTLFNVTAYQTFVAYGLFNMQAGRAAIVGNTAPLWVALLSPWLLQVSTTRGEFLGIVLGFGGLAALILPALSTLGGSLAGEFLMIAAAVASAFGAIFMKLHKWQTPISVLTGWSLLVGGVPIYATVLLSGAHVDMGGLTVPVWAAFAYTIAISTIFGNWCWFRIMTLLPAHKGASAIFGIPPVGLLGSALFLHEPVAANDMVGMTLVLAGIYCALFF
jgi:drug/metabolite transporter (DMT)-like permease